MSDEHTTGRPVIIYDVRRGVTVYVVVLAAIAALANLGNYSSDPGFFGGLALSIIFFGTIVVLALRYLLPRIEFFEGFARCSRGLAKPNDVPYQDLSLAWTTVSGRYHGALRICDTRRPLPLCYRITDRKIASLDTTLFDWLEIKTGRSPSQKGSQFH